MSKAAEDYVQQGVSIRSQWYIYKELRTLLMETSGAPILCTVGTVGTSHPPTEGRPALGQGMRESSFGPRIRVDQFLQGLHISN